VAHGHPRAMPGRRDAHRAAAVDALRRRTAVRGAADAPRRRAASFPGWWRRLTECRSGHRGALEEVGVSRGVEAVDVRVDELAERVAVEQTVLDDLEGFG